MAAVDRSDRGGDERRLPGTARVRNVTIILLISISIIGFTNESIKMDILILVMIAMISSCTGLTRTSIKALSIFAILQGIKYFIFPILPDRISAHFLSRRGY